MGRVDEKVVLISGGARGMGAAHAEMLEREGARVVIGDVLDDAGREVAEKLGSSAHFVHLDVTDPDQWEAAVDACVATFGRIDALVSHGVGIRRRRWTDELRPNQDLDQARGINRGWPPPGRDYTQYSFMGWAYLSLLVSGGRPRDSSMVRSKL